MAEWLRRAIRNRLGIARGSSNLSDVVFFSHIAFYQKIKAKKENTLRVGIEPTTLRLEVSRAIQLRQRSCMHLVGFEPTPPKRLELESSALDHSATNAADMIN